MAVTGKPGTVEVIDRKRIVVTDEKIPGAKQPYHFAKTLGLSEAEKHLAKCARVSERLALAAVRDLVGELKSRDSRVVGAAVLLASGRPLPPLAEILASHALIHTAEGEFFRRVLWEGCERLEIRVTRIRERELEEKSEAQFGKRATQLRRKIANLGKTLGPPRTQDQKTAVLAAWMVLAGGAV